MGKNEPRQGTQGDGVKNAYVHFPFCRSKCAYCALHSRPGSSEAERKAYVSRIKTELKNLSPLETLYFGGGSPALCDLGELEEPLSRIVGPGTEFTVELHPLDATEEKLDELESIGVNRVSMGIQSLDVPTLRSMGRPYGPDEAFEAFSRASERFGNSGIDLIAGYPGDPCDYGPLKDWPAKHVSVYSLILEPEAALAKRSVSIPSDDETMDRIKTAGAFLESLGFSRYEISNYAKRGFECRHNLAVWFGEDYAGIGDGAHGRIRLVRTDSGRPGSVTEAQDRIERTIFRLRTKYGLDTSGFPEWRKILDRFAKEGLLDKSGVVYTLTKRGAEVCDSILAELV